MTKELKVSIIIPTLNSQRTLQLCLDSINNQDYRGEMEILVADGGSIDDTLKIAKVKGTRIIKNRLKTGEAGKAVGAKYASGEILAFIDSDNVLPSKDWLSRLIKPFGVDEEIIATEPLFFTYRKSDHWLTRYFALLGMGDPLSLFIGWYDKYSYITGKWTGLNIKIQNKKGYFSFYLKGKIPTIGANGFFVRKSELLKYPIRDYLFDIDVLKILSSRKKIKVAKVKVGIIHLFSRDIGTFIRKQQRRIKDYIFFGKQGLRVADTDNKIIYWGIIKFVVSTILILPLLIQTLIGYSRKKDTAWLFHPLACWLTLFVYTIETLKSPFIKGEFDRKGWKQ